MTLKNYTFAMILLAFALGVWAQAEDPKLPSGKSQKEEILKQDHTQSLQDAAELVKLSEELKLELEKNDRHVVSVSSLKKTEQIEKLAKRIRSRLKRY